MSISVRRSPRPTSPVVDSPSITLPVSRFSKCIEVRTERRGFSHLGWCVWR